MKKLLSAIMMFALVSCSYANTKSPKETSPFENSTCRLPCWYGMTVGKTTKQEALDILQSVGLVNPDSIEIVEAEPKYIFDEIVYFTLGKGPRFLKAGSDISDDEFTREPTIIRIDYDWGGEISILDGKVSKMEFSGDLGLTIQQVIDIFGDPSYAISLTSPGGFPEVEFLNPAQGVDFGYGTEDYESEITPETKISDLILFDPTLYNEMLENYQFAFGQRSEEMDKYEWKGFGKIDMYWYVKK